MKSEQERVQELEKILKELIAEYGDKFVQKGGYKLYYKIDGKIYFADMYKVCKSNIDLFNCIFKKLILKMRQLARSNPEFILYVDGEGIDVVDFQISSCINDLYFYLFPIVSPLVPAWFNPIPPESRYALNIIKRYISTDNDPLTQVLDYVTLILHSTHLYVCPEIHFVVYLNGDLDYLSMASAKRGVVAYCTTFGDYIQKIISGQWNLLNNELWSIWLRATEKVDDYRKQIIPLSADERKKYCNVYAIKDLVSKEIEEVDKVIKKYGIIRVAFPLD